MNKDIFKVVLLSIGCYFCMKFFVNLVSYYGDGNVLGSKQASCLTEAFSVKFMPDSNIIRMYKSTKGDKNLRYEFGFTSDKGDSEVFRYYENQLALNGWHFVQNSKGSGNFFRTEKYKKSEINGVAYYIRKYKYDNYYRVGVFVDYEDKADVAVDNNNKSNTVPFYAGWMTLIK